MADDKFDLIFRGELVPGADLATVKQNLSRLFKMDPARVELLFSGKAIVLKRGMDMDAAAKYRVAIKKAGARVNTIASKTASDTSAMREVQPAPASATQPASRPAPVAADAGLTLAPMAGDLLAPAEKRQQEPVEVDISGLSLRPTGGSLLDDSERDDVVPLPLDLEGLELAPAGTEVLKPEERKPVVDVQVDTEGLSVAPPGERLEPEKAAPPPAPDVSGISLADQQ